MTDRMSVAEFRQAQRDAWTETEFTDAVVALFQEHGWLVHHDRPARTEAGWRTAVQGDAGFPDIVAAKRGRVVFAELKVKGRKPSPEQEKWLDTLGAGLAPSTGNDFEMPQAWEHELFLWRPSAWPTIERIAQGK